jgi:uracil-DNA glycosylase
MVVTLKQKKLQLTVLAENISSQLSCKLKDQANNLVLGKGHLNAKIFFIGEAPGKKEDEQGLPFVCRSGQLLDKAIHEATIPFRKIYIANILKYRPPKNRNPTKKEIQEHTPYLLEQIEIIKPKIIVPLGNYATKFILGNCDVSEMKNIQSISFLRGRVHNIIINKTSYIVFPMYHPSATIYNKKLLETFYQDVHQLNKILYS